MALAVTSITPNNGPTAGKDRVKIEGTDFDIHPYPPTSSGYIGDPGPSVKVLFGLLEAKNVWVYPKPGGLPGETVIECSTPRYTGDPKAIPAFVDVTIENLLNPGSIVVSSGYKYRHQDAKPDTAPSMLNLVTRSLLLELARQIPLKDYVDRTHTDYDDSVGDGLNIVKIADIPALLLGGPGIDRSNGVYRAPDYEKEFAPDDTRIIRASTYCDLTYTITIIDEHVGRLNNLTRILANFVDENGRLGVELVPDNPAEGFMYFDLDWLELPDVGNQASKNNLLASSGQLVVHGVPLDRIAGIEVERTVVADDVVLGFGTL